jgi:hypothetical protein
MPSTSTNFASPIDRDVPAAAEYEVVDISKGTALRALAEWPRKPLLESFMDQFLSDWLRVI